MFSATANPYDEIIVKATDENLASEDWALNMEVCDKVTGDGQDGARQAVASLQKRLAHRNPSVQLYTLELANSLAQNCGNELLGELSSRNWTSALDRLINDRATAVPVKKKALGFVKVWAKQFEETGDPNLGIMGELYDQLRAKNHVFDEPEVTPESAEEARQRQEDEELQRVLELSKQDKGGRSAYPYQPSAGGGSSSSVPQASASSSAPAPAPSAALANSQQAQHQPAPTNYVPQPQRIYSPQPLEPELPKVDINTATRVRAIYPFTGQEVGELDFERGDLIKVLDRGFKEWWRGACNGKIGIFPVTYVEALPEPTPRELQEEAQEEAKVFASLGLVDQLLQTLKGVDPARGDRLDDRPEIEEMYQASVGLQGQISSLIKKYSDQKAELEHMNANFIRAMGQYEELRNGQPPVQAQSYYAAPPQAQSQPAHPQQAAAQAPAPAYNYQQFPQDQQQPQQQTPPTAQYPQQTPSPSIQAPYAGPPQYPAQADPASNQNYQQHQQQPFYHHAGSTVSVNRIPSGPAPAAAPSGLSPSHLPPQQGAPGYPPQSPPSRQGTEPGVAGVGTEHQPWEYYQGQGQGQGPATHQPQQGQGQPGGYYQQQQQPAPAYGGYEMPDGRAYAPQHAGQQSVENVAAGVNRMSVA